MILWMGLLTVFGAPATRAQAAVYAATIFPLSTWVAELTGNAADIVTLLPAGANPHTFEPVPATLKALSRARLLVSVGAGLDGWATRLLGGTAEGVATLVLGDHVPLLPLEEEQGRDPHFWLDPILVRDYALPVLVDVLCRIEPERAPMYRRRASQWHDELSQLDARMRERLAPVRGRAYVAVHSAWRYFARRYGLVEAATVEPIPGRELSAKEMVVLVEEVRRSGARALVVEPFVFSKLARQIAGETGVRLVTVDPFGSGSLIGGYTRLLEENARRFVEALQ